MTNATTKRRRATSDMVPPAPLPIIEAKADTPVAAKSNAPLDIAFLRRTYLSIGWLGALCSVLVWCVSAKMLAAWSFAGGIILGALLLKSQEILVRRVLQPQAQVKASWIKIVPFWLLAPVKYLLVVGILATLWSQQLINVVWLAFGFMLVQLVIGAKIIGRVLASRIRPVKDVTIQR